MVLGRVMSGGFLAAAALAPSVIPHVERPLQLGQPRGAVHTPVVLWRGGGGHGGAVAAGE